MLLGLHGVELGELLALLAGVVVLVGGFHGVLPGEVGGLEPLQLFQVPQLPLLRLRVVPSEDLSNEPFRSTHLKRLLQLWPSDGLLSWPNC